MLYRFTCFLFFTAIFIQSSIQHFVVTHPDGYVETISLSQLEHFVMVQERDLFFTPQVENWVNYNAMILLEEHPIISELDFTNKSSNEIAEEIMKLDNETIHALWNFMVGYFDVAGLELEVAKYKK